MKPLSLKVVLIEPIPIVRMGIDALMRKLSGYKVQITDLSDTPSEYRAMAEYRDVDVVLIDTQVGGIVLDDAFRKACDARRIAILSTPIPPSMLRGYDGYIQLSDSSDVARSLLDKLMSVEVSQPEPLSEQQSLTPREREIVVCVVKGMTNKAIAESLFLSTHTVITHRRNIAKKLQIHSASGLTIYAIVNKLVELGDIDS